MVTQKGENTYVVGITGNFDDAQSGVKKMFNDKELAKELDQAGYQFSSANSINTDVWFLRWLTMSMPM